MGYKITKPIRVVELFSGIGAQAQALKNIGANFEHYRTCEWEINAIASYKAIHMPNDSTDYSENLTKDELVEYLSNKGISTDGKKPLYFKTIAKKNETWLRDVYNNIKATNNLVNITQAKGEDLGIVDTDKYDYILTYSFPCQDISLAGKGAGLSKGSGTRSGLLWEVERLLKETEHLPQILLMENVTQIHSKKNIEDFNQWISFLESLGYSNYWQDLNAKDYGIPQNRNRTFMVSILGDCEYKFPNPIPLKLRLKDMLEDSVEEKYYLSERALSGIQNSQFTQKQKQVQQGDVCSTLLARDYKDPKCVEVDEKYYLSDKMVKYISKKGTNGYANKDTRINLDIARPITTEQDKRAGTTNYICKDLPENANLGDLDVERLFGLYDEKGKGKQGGSVFSKDGLCPTITTGASNNWNVLINDEGESKGNKTQTKRLYGVYDKNGKRHQAGSVYDIDGLAPTLDTAQGGNRQPCIEILEATKKGYAIAHEGDGVYINRPHQKRGVVQKDMIQTIKTSGNDLGVVVKDSLFTDLEKQMITEDGSIKRYINSDVVDTFEDGDCADISFPNGYNKAKRVFKGYAPALNGTTFRSFITKIEEKPRLRIRKLTPKECWRLMGFDDESFERAEKVNSNTQLYRQAGNSICINVLEAIFKELLE